LKGKTKTNAGKGGDKKGNREHCGTPVVTNNRNEKKG